MLVVGEAGVTGEDKQQAHITIIANGEATLQTKHY
jgi:hypothetical protein